MREKIAIYVAGTTFVYTTESDKNDSFFWGSPSPLVSTLTAHNSIISFSEISTNLDIRNPVSTTGGSSIVIPRKIYNTGSTSIQQPEDDFSGFLPIGNVIRLADSLSSSATTAKFLLPSGTNIQTNTYYHIGLEVIYVSSYVSSSQTATIERGKRGTIPQPHWVNSVLGLNPTITNFPCAWVGRPIYIATKDRLWFRGFLTTAPVFDQETITLNWAPIDAKLSSQLPSCLTSPTTGFYQGAHFVSSPLRFEQISHIDSYLGGFTKSGNILTPWTTIYEPSDYIKYYVTPEYDVGTFRVISPGSPSFIEFSANEAPSYFATQFQRQSNGTYSTVGLTYLPDGGVLANGGGRHFVSPPIGTSGGTVTNEYILTVLSNYTLTRPQQPASIDELDPTFGIQYNSSQKLLYIKNNAGQNIGWLDKNEKYWGLVWSESVFGDSQNNDSEASLSKKFNETGSPVNDMKYNIASGVSTEPANSVQRLKTEIDNYNERFRPTSFSDDSWVWDGVCRYPLRIIPSKETLNENYDISVQGVNGIKSHITFIPVGRTITPLFILKMADQWWELGEKYICFQNSLSSGHFACKAKWFEPGQSEALECTLDLKFVNYIEGAGYRYEVLNNKQYTNPAGIGDWCGNHAIFSRIPKTPYQRDYEAFLNVICSTDGDNPNYSISGGLGIPDSWIDEISFIKYTLNDFGLKNFSLDLTEKTANEAFLPILLLSCSAIVGKNVDQYYKISRIPLGIPDNESYALAVTDDDFIGLPQTSWRADITTQYIINFLGEGEDDTISVPVSDSDAAQIFGTGGTLNIDLTCLGQKGKDFNPFISLQPYLTRIIETFGKPQREWTFTIPFKKGKNLNLGDVIQIDSNYLYGYQTGRGFSGKARIIGISQDFMGDTTKITCWGLWKNSGCYITSFSARVNSSTNLYVYKDFVCISGTDSITASDFIGSWLIATSGTTHFDNFSISQAVQSGDWWILTYSGLSLIDKIGEWFTIYRSSQDVNNYARFMIGSTDLR